MADEVLNHVYNYALNCFCESGHEESFIQKLETYLLDPSSESNIADLLAEQERMGPIIAGDAGSFLERRVQLEARSVELLSEKLPFGKVLITKSDFLDAVEFIKDGIGPIGPRKASSQKLTDRMPW